MSDPGGSPTMLNNHQLTTDDRLLFRNGRGGRGWTGLFNPKRPVGLDLLAFRFSADDDGAALFPQLLGDLIGNIAGLRVVTSRHLAQTADSHLDTVRLERAERAEIGFDQRQSRPNGFSVRRLTG